MATLMYPVREEHPKPRDSFNSKGYIETATNPEGFHWAEDFAVSPNCIIQLPERSELRAKGHDAYAGYWMEWEILVGNFKGRYIRFFHMNRPCGLTVGTVKNRGYAVGRTGNTGNTTGPHLHMEISSRPWHVSRDPRYNPYPYMMDAWKEKDW